MALLFWWHLKKWIDLLYNKRYILTGFIFSDFMTIQKEFIQLEQVTFNNTLVIMDELLRVSQT